MNKKIRKKTIIILSVIIVLLLPFVIFGSIKYAEIKEQERLAEEARIAAEKEAARIAALPIKSTLYLAIDEPLEIDAQLLDGQSIKIITLQDKNYIVGKNIGDSTIYSKNDDSKYVVSVSNLYDIAHIDNYRENIFIGAYTTEEAAYLDKVLAGRIEAVGYQTRAAVAEAARFLSMCFKYKIPYFCENGRLSIDGCDGEGRFYHKGLYLSEDKFDILNKDGIRKGPQIWGGLMHHSCGNLLKPNGLDCSGFVTWCMVQAGFDPGDLGAGSNEKGYATCLIDLANGDAGAIWLDNIDPNEIQAGDIIAWEGTVAIVVGVDEENIYTAHQYWDNGLEVVTDTKISLKDYPYGEDCGDWQYVELMDSYYEKYGNGQGKYTPMWPTKLN